MLQIGNHLVSEAIFSEEFQCELGKCKGKCCIEGDLGAPLDVQELAVLQDIYPKIKQLLRKEGISAIEEQGTYIEYEDEGYYTPLVDGKECAYVVFEQGIALCGIEKACKQGLIDFPKPISCHLYPIRLWQKNEIIGINYEEWDICQCACQKGKEQKIPVFQFLKEAIVRRFGSDFYEELEQCYQELQMNF